MIIAYEKMYNVYYERLVLQAFFFIYTKNNRFSFGHIRYRSRVYIKFIEVPTRAYDIPYTIVFTIII